MQNGSKNMDTSIAEAMKLFNPLPNQFDKSEIDRAIKIAKKSVTAQILHVADTEQLFKLMTIESEEHSFLRTMQVRSTLGQLYRGNLLAWARGDSDYEITIEDLALWDSGFVMGLILLCKALGVDKHM